MRLIQIKLLRRIVLPLFAALNPGDITISHHYTAQPIRLHSFRHKGYWYHGRRRERATMSLFARLLQPGHTVLEVGGHIGYVSLFFKSLVQFGSVIVFEPGQNNLPYIRQNLQNRDIELIEKAAGNFNGRAKFFLDSLTGQNNSFLRNFEKLEENEKNAFISVRKDEVEVDVVRLDDFGRERNLKLNFIKIDVEGAEWDVLQGMTDLLASQQPALMIEVQNHRSQIYKMLLQNGYKLYTPQLLRINDEADLNSNVFALHEGHQVHLQIGA